MAGCDLPCDNKRNCAELSQSAVVCLFVCFPVDVEAIIATGIFVSKKNERKK